MTKVWHGPLGHLMEKHLALRAAVGRLNRADESTLHNFNEFLRRKYPASRTLSRIVILDYLRTKKNLKIAGRRNAVIHIRQFCKFLIQRGTACYLPDRTLMPKYVYRPRYCPIVIADVQTVMTEARTIRLNRPFIGETYATMFGLLWCTGLRRREIVRLNHEDVDLDAGLLFIRQTKFYKDRVVPLEATVVKALRQYKIKKQAQGYSTAQRSTFFVNLNGTAMPGHSLSTAFNRIVKRMGMKSAEGKPPALHDFRHNFATQTMARIYRDPETFPVSASMARLSTYLGHTSIFYTQYYLHPDFNLMQEAAEKFGGRSG